MKITIERAQQKDLASIAQLFNSYRVFYKQKSDYNLAFNFLSERFDKSESVIFFAQDEDENYLGFTQLFPSFSSVTAQRTWILNDLFVSQDIRSHGVGTLLLDKAKKFAMETKAKGIALETSEGNTRAQKLYESLGYIKDTEFSYFLKV
ncbi:MAG: GNAT family N-acetyltransferase [Alcanivoracaceae bacterium]|nr:GNAT family N-acetyltransferase [Alcanivoracaceae bacterium]